MFSQRPTWRPPAILNFKLFVQTNVSESAFAYKISSTSDDFSPKYDNIVIFKMAIGRHLESSKFDFFSLDRLCSPILCLRTKFRASRTIRCDKNDIFQYGVRQPCLILVKL